MQPFISHSRSNTGICMIFLALTSSILACSLGQPQPTPTQVPTVTRLAPTNTAEPTITQATAGDLIRQWASAGEATSEFGADSWSAQQAAGAPDSLTCGDQVSAWASATSTGVDSITLYFYDQPVIPTEINIIQSYNPSQVVKVELLDPYGEYYDAIIYEAEPIATAECPYTLSIPVTGIDYLVMGVRITIDQSVLGLGWNEIDAVELVGYPEGVTGSQSPVGAGIEGIWDSVYALPIYSSAENVKYPDEMSLSYTVGNSNRQDVLSFLFDELQGIGWLLDADAGGNCLTNNICKSKLAGLDYQSADNTMWYFIHYESSDAGLVLVVTESGGVVSVSMGLY
jgi:hypothetical protein